MTLSPQLRVNDINLADPDLFVHGDPHEAWRILRAEAPVHWNAGTNAFPGFWSVTKYDDVMAISRDPATFISSAGITMFTNPADRDAAPPPSMITTDPPRHVRLRRLVNRGFTPRQVAVLEPHVREIARQILDEVAPAGACDFVTDVAARLPLAVICELVGVPRADWNSMFELTNRTLGADDPEYQTVAGDRIQTATQARLEMFSYFQRLLGKRRAKGGVDLVSVLVAADIDGEQLTDEEVLSFCFLLIVAGNETTRNATSGGMLALIQHPDQRARVLADAALIPSAVEEMLRWVSPVAHMMRSATRDVQIRDQLIRAGDHVIMWYPSANRDEEQFPDPFRFDVGRTPNDHIAFGIGEHFCLGSGLARLELRVMFEELLCTMPDIAPDGPVERLRSTFIGGIKHMPVRFTAR